jgi:hypothetical protein
MPLGLFQITPSLLPLQTGKGPRFGVTFPADTADAGCEEADTDADAKDAGANNAAVIMPTDAASVMILTRKFMPILSLPTERLNIHLRQ